MIYWDWVPPVSQNEKHRPTSICWPGVIMWLGVMSVRSNDFGHRNTYLYVFFHPIMDSCCKKCINWDRHAGSDFRNCTGRPKCSVLFYYFVFVINKNELRKFWKLGGYTPTMYVHILKHLLFVLVPVIIPVCCFLVTEVSIFFWLRKFTTKYGGLQIRKKKYRRLKTLILGSNL